jgi:tetratricopeptide (TPR) repeat protein
LKIDFLRAGWHGDRSMRGPLLAVLGVFFCLQAVPADAETASSLAGAARAECEAGRRAPDRVTRKDHFERGQTLAEHAVGLDDGSADAHFALFCNMGELMRLDGESLSSALRLRRLMAEVDRTLELNPQHTDALAAKGTLLLRLPRFFGGDAQRGEALLREVIQKDPNAFSSRLTLAKTCEARGDRTEAMAFATRALQIAREQGRADKVAEAQATLSELRASR